MRDHRVAQAAPVMAKMWDNDDRLVRIFVLQYCSAVRAPETFEIAWRAYSTLPEKHELRISAVGAMAACVQKLDALAKRAIPLILEHYSQDGFDAREQFEAALCRAAGREPKARPTDEPADIAQRLEEWKAWWRKAAN
jgi:hypothetical protein